MGFRSTILLGRPLMGFIQELCCQCPVVKDVSTAVLDQGEGGGAPWREHLGPTGVSLCLFLPPASLSYPDPCLHELQPPSILPHMLFTCMLPLSPVRMPLCMLHRMP